ncbi:MAG: hypothetical protein K6B68_11965 [Eubacterium sp.]|nr:hypothetical protein [Eubacterium sp.]
MYQIRDKKEQKIIARFLEKTDAEAFLRYNQGEDRERYALVKAGEREKKS